MSVIRYDQGSWPDKAEMTPDGFLRVDAPITRLGVLIYKNSDGSPRGELRHPDDWSAPSALASLASLPITNGHPPRRLKDGLPLVDAQNARRLAIGWTGESVRVDGVFLRTALKIIDEAGVAAVQRGRRGTSTGVEVDLSAERGVYEGVAYEYRQLNPRGNHIAIVDSPRAGTMIRVDGNQESDDDVEGETKMVKVTLDGIGYDAPPEVANALSRAQATIAELTRKVGEAAETGKAVADKVAAERDTYKERLDAAEKRDIRGEVRTRVALLSAARQALPEEQFEKLDEMPDADIRKAVVAATYPALKLDDKSADYITMRYEMALEDKAAKQAHEMRFDHALARQREQLVPRADSSTDDGLSELIRQTNDRIATQWKPRAA